MNSASSHKTMQSYNAMADIYETRWAAYLSHTHQRFLEQIKIQEEDVMLDISCGTGLLARYILNRGDSFKQMVLNDIACNMQAHARKRFAHLPHISFTAFSAEAVDFPDQTFTKVFCLNAFHNYYHQKKVLAECQRVLKPGGQLFLLDWNRSGLFRVINYKIKIKGPEHIATWSAKEVEKQVKKQGYMFSSTDEWNYRFWKFFYVIAEKKIKNNRL